MIHPNLLNLSALLYTLGLLSLALFWRNMAYHFLFFGLFALVNGLWLFSKMVFGRFLVDWLAVDFVNAFIRYSIAIPIWLLLVRFLGNGWRSSMRWGLWAFVVFALAGILWDLAHWQPFSAMRVYNVLVPLGVAVVVGNLFQHGWKASREVWMVRSLAIVVPIAMILFFRDPCNFWGSFWFSCQRQGYVDILMLSMLGYIVVRKVLFNFQNGGSLKLGDWSLANQEYQKQTKG